MDSQKLDDELLRIRETRHHDPFSVLGRHTEDGQTLVRVFNPQALDVGIVEGDIRLERLADSEFFEWRGDGKDLPSHYRLIWRDTEHREHINHDPYCYDTQILDFDLHLFSDFTVFISMSPHRCPCTAYLMKP